MQWPPSMPRSRPLIKNKLANAGVAAADILRQNALINAIGDTSQIIGQKLNDPAALLLGAARAQSSASTNLWYIASGRMAEQALPLVRNVLEALIYALFPLVLLLVMLTSGRTTGMALKAYAVAFIGFSSGPDLRHLQLHGHSCHRQGSGGSRDLGGGLRGMALQTAAGIYTNAISNQAVVGNLVVSIPIIAWYALKRTGTSRAGGVQRPGRTAVGHRLRRQAGRGREHESPATSRSIRRNWRPTAVPHICAAPPTPPAPPTKTSPIHARTAGTIASGPTPQHRRYAGVSAATSEFFPPRSECDHEVKTGGHRALGRAERSPLAIPRAAARPPRRARCRAWARPGNQHHPGANAAAGLRTTGERVRGQGRIDCAIRNSVQSRSRIGFGIPETCGGNASKTGCRRNSKHDQSDRCRRQESSILFGLRRNYQRRPSRRRLRQERRFPQLAEYESRIRSANRVNVPPCQVAPRIRQQ
ncbi:MAG: conjugal transfer protein TraG N-terminal domain-containing protein [Betaproteobacteria bacterium]|nr:conjugal transfer protein TraG N-terminal domain-containing protein [Betaproteobacteria bacterium]